MHTTFGWTLILFLLRTPKKPFEASLVKATCVENYQRVGRDVEQWLEPTTFWRQKLKPLSNKNSDVGVRLLMVFKFGASQPAVILWTASR